jgi:hypothetical protein
MHTTTWELRPLKALHWMYIGLCPNIRVSHCSLGRKVAYKPTTARCCLKPEPKIDLPR